MNRDTADDVMTATLANTRPTIDRLALEQMEKRLGPDHPAVVRARDHLTAWRGGWPSPTHERGDPRPD